MGEEEDFRYRAEKTRSLSTVLSAPLKPRWARIRNSVKACLWEAEARSSTEAREGTPFRVLLQHKLAFWTPRLVQPALSSDRKGPLLSPRRGR